MRSTQLIVACGFVQAFLAAAREELAAAKRRYTAAKDHMNALNAIKNAARVAKVRCTKSKHFSTVLMMSAEDTAGHAVWLQLSDLWLRSLPVDSAAMAPLAQQVPEACDSCVPSVARLWGPGSVTCRVRQRASCS